MSEENNTQQTEQPTPETPPSDGTQNTDTGNKSIPYDRFQQVIGERNDLRQRLEKLEQAEQERNRKKAEEEGRYQDIIADLQPEAERAKQLQAELEAYQQRDQAELEAELNALDDDLKELLPEGSASSQLAWLRSAKRKGLFDKPKPPATDAGAEGDPKQPDKDLPPQQQRLYELAKQRRYIRRGNNS